MEKKDKIGLSKKRKAEIKKLVDEAPLKAVKTELDRYVDTIVRYTFLDVCTAGAYFNHLYNQEFLTWIELNNKLKNKKSFFEVMFGEKLSPEEQKKKNIEYYKRLISWAKWHLSHLSDEEKKKIITDGLEQMNLWNEIFHQTYKLNKEIQKKERKVQKNDRKKR